MSLFITELFENPRLFAAIAVLVIFSICLHEFCHAWVALKQGDPTAADRGHLTLNPLRQMGLFSIITFLMIGIAWGAVPVDPARMRHKYSHLLVALAGPAANLGLFVVFTVLAALLFKAETSNGFAFAMLLNGAMLNVVLMIFNLLPIPGLDGWVVVETCFPGVVRTGSEVVRGAFFILIVLLLFGFPWLFKIGSVMTGWLLNGCLTVLGV